MENETKPQLFIMDERLGDPIPLAEIKEISEPTLDEEYDMPDISHLKEGFEIPFEVKMKKSAINKLFQPCFGREPYRNLEKCAKCILKKDCVVAKIENNFNMRFTLDNKSQGGHQWKRKKRNRGDRQKRHSYPIR